MQRVDFVCTDGRTHVDIHAEDLDFEVVGVHQTVIDLRRFNITREDVTCFEYLYMLIKSDAAIPQAAIGRFSWEQLKATFHISELLMLDPSLGFDDAMCQSVLRFWQSALRVDRWQVAT